MSISQIGVVESVVVQVELEAVLRTTVDGHGPVGRVLELHIVIQTDEEGRGRVGQLGLVGDVGLGTERQSRA